MKQYTKVAKELKEKESFKLPGQRKWRKISKIIRNSPLPSLEGRILIVLDNCKQCVLEQNRVVEFRGEANNG